MKYVILGFFAFFLLIFLLCYFIRRKYAIRKVKCKSDEEKLCTINAMLEPFGFEFNVDQDVVISKNDAWQRDFGYMNIYDKKAPFFNMVMDSLPICFNYNCKNYRIEFWKGQYGITTGAEIGIYIQDKDCHKGVYRAAKDNERLDMTFILYKKCKLFSRTGLSWWLTGFDVGNFSRPKDLKMSICVKFPNYEMKDAFVKSLIQAGYSKANIEICDNVVCFNYCYPPYCKPNFIHKIIKCIAQIFNYINCRIYMWFTRPFNRTLDKLTYLRYMAPCLYKFIISLCIPHKCKKCSCKKCYHKK